MLNLFILKKRGQETVLKIKANIISTQTLEYKITTPETK